MNIDERLERLTERHEALAQTVEIYVISSRENSERTEAQFRQTDSKIQANAENISRLIEVSSMLVRTAEAHERRITGLEGRA